MLESELRRRLPPGLAHNRLPPADHRPAAVLVPLEPEHGVWLTKRSANLPSHAGQVAFPGGKIERFDASAEAAALRETEEEIALPPSQVEILGRMDDFITGTGFHIVPVVALIPRHPIFAGRPGEVQDVFCLPFEILLDPAAPRRRRATWLGVERDFWVWPHENYVIWGGDGGDSAESRQAAAGGTIMGHPWRADRVGGAAGGTDGGRCGAGHAVQPRGGGC